MKVIFFIPSLGSGGAERVVSVLASELAQRDHDVHIAMLANRNCNYSLAPEVTVHYLDCEHELGMSSAKRYLKRLARIRDLVKCVTPDSVISFMAETNIDVCFALIGIHVPIIVSERNDPALDPVSRVKQWLRKVAYFKPDYFVFQTPDAQKYFSQRIQNRSSIILNPLSEHLPESYMGIRELRIVSVSRLNKQKNIPLLLSAFEEFSRNHPQYTLEIFGEGDLEETIRKEIQELALDEKVILKGFCKDVHEKIRNAAMFVMTSDYEGMPNALLESMALGLPCISTDCPCGGPRMLIKSKWNGLLIPVGDREELYGAMCHLADDSESASEMGRNAQNVREMANLYKIISEWEKIMYRHKS